MDNPTPVVKNAITPSVQVSVAMVHKTVDWFKLTGTNKGQEVATVLSSIHAIGEMVSVALRKSLDADTARYLNRNFSAAYFHDSERAKKEMAEYQSKSEKGEEVYEPITLTSLSTVQSFLMQDLTLEKMRGFVGAVQSGQWYLANLATDSTVARTPNLDDLVKLSDHVKQENSKLETYSADWTNVGHLMQSKLTEDGLVRSDWIGLGSRIAHLLGLVEGFKEVFTEEKVSALAKLANTLSIEMGTVIAGVRKNEEVIFGGREFTYNEDKAKIAEYLTGPINYLYSYIKLYEFAMDCVLAAHSLAKQYLDDFAKGVAILMTEPASAPYLDKLKTLHKELVKGSKECEMITNPHLGVEDYGVEDMDIGYGGPSLGVVEEVPFPKGELEVSLEGIASSIWDVIAKIFDKLGKMIDKFITWLKSISGMGGSNSSFYTPETGKKINAIMNDSELKHAIEDGLKEASKATTIGNEDFFSAPIEQTMEIFAGYQKSLTEKEVDFLTSGHRYKLIEKAVNDYTRARLPEYVMGIEYDLFTWGQEGLNKSLHTGNGDVAVENFVKEQKAKLAEIERKYEHSSKFIRSMADDFAAIANANAARDRLNVFLKAPSGLFPHLEHLWKVIHFDRISEEDSKLINTLEDIHKKHENMLQRFRAQAKENDKFWPAEDEMLKMIMAAHKESSTNLSKVVRVAGFIKESALTAFNATMKSFSYLIRILGVVSKMGNVDQAKVKRSVDIISQRRRDLNSLLKIV